MMHGVQCLYSLFFFPINVLLSFMHELLLQLELARFVASDKPLVAAIKVSERIATIIKSLLISPISAQV